MKNLKYVLVLLVCSLSLSAFADAKIDCHKMATSQRSLTKDQAIRLCRGAEDAVAIIDCHKMATDKRSLSKEQAIRLCQPVVIAVCGG